MAADLLAVDAVEGLDSVIERVRSGRSWSRGRSPLREGTVVVDGGERGGGDRWTW